MTEFSFQLLERQQQLEAIQTQGVYVGKRYVGEMTVILYQLESFYVEIYYRSYRKFIDFLKYSSSVEILQPYLAQIDVNELVNVH